MNDIQTIVPILLALGLGALIAAIVIKRSYKAKEKIAGDKALMIVKEAESEAEVTKKNKILEAKGEIPSAKSRT